MARLVVEAQGTAAEGPAVQGVAAVGNSDPMHLIVSVTDADGVPVSGLAAADFRIDAKIVGAFGSQVEIAMVGGGQQGDYALWVVPVTFQGYPVHLGIRTLHLLPRRHPWRRPGPDRLRRVRAGPPQQRSAGRREAVVGYATQVSWVLIPAIGCRSSTSCIGPRRRPAPRSTTPCGTFLTQAVPSCAVAFALAVLVRTGWRWVAWTALALAVALIVVSILYAQHDPSRGPEPAR
jgi:hypothetical protein